MQRQHWMLIPHNAVHIQHTEHKDSHTTTENRSEPNHTTADKKENTHTLQTYTQHTIKAHTPCGYLLMHVPSNHSLSSWRSAARPPRNNNNMCTNITGDFREKCCLPLRSPYFSFSPSPFHPFLLCMSSSFCPCNTVFSTSPFSDLHVLKWSRDKLF